MPPPPSSILPAATPTGAAEVELDDIETPLPLRHTSLVVESARIVAVYGPRESIRTGLPEARPQARPGGAGCPVIGVVGVACQPANAGAAPDPRATMTGNRGRDAGRSKRADPPWKGPESGAGEGGSRESARGTALDGPRRAAKDLGRLGLGQVVEVAQDEHRSLTRRQACERVDQLGTRLEPGEQIPSRSLGDRRRSVELAAAAGAAAGVVKGQVDEDSPRVRAWLRHPSHTWPPPRDLEQALLHEILGLASIPRDQVGRLQQLLNVAGDELVEVVHHPI